MYKMFTFTVNDSPGLASSVAKSSSVEIEMEKLLGLRPIFTRWNRGYKLIRISAVLDKTSNKMLRLHGNESLCSYKRHSLPYAYCEPGLPIACIRRETKGRNRALMTSI